MDCLRIHDPAALEAYRDTPLYAGFDPACLAQHGPDLHLLGLDAERRPVARCSLWWCQAPELPGERLGVVGHFAAAAAEAAGALLEQAFATLRLEGCSLAVGPMDGNTWRRYRFVVDAGREPPFFLEPENPPQYPEYFRAAGFAPLAEYTSALTEDLSLQDARIAGAIARLRAGGVGWRPLDPGRFEAELKAIYRLSVLSFTENFLYTPIGEAEFLAQYRAVEPYLDPALTLMAEREGELVGYLFGVPDLNQARRGDAVDTFIIKTVAVLPGRRNAGLGSVLVAEAQRIAREKGYRRAIHALMHDNNKSRNISGHYAQTMRRYALFQRRL
jgi:GNAT superfamily N-acetyltransferase